ncbi:APA family basic amino acid/polyamine antiporter [Chitinophaga skermanii]|uniref:APA family basic amino acid/polyamine antiporter n=1 Tax=Chitinophaga skermanii TaxID=331697 RepID=A0A327R2T2_9BACT|nr:amino acid permease [Chitinophaga skermanii]RAJ10545.1 APA family basic amino acid/polyamine antiporter [Chitinophaga skermanii]
MSIKPKLGLFDFTMIVVSLVIGMGIFRTPINVAREVSSPTQFYAIWVLGGIVTLCGALSYAEIGARFPVAGGFYKVLSYCYHPAYAFMINWTVLISNAASVAAVCMIGAEYIGPVMLPPGLQNEVGHKIVGILAILLLYGINMLGIRMSATWQNFLTVIKITMIGLLCMAIWGNNVAPPSTTAVRDTIEQNWFYVFGAALVPVFFTYGGYQQTINFGSDVRNPSRNMPRGIFIGMAIILTAYITINYAYVKVIGFEQLRTSDALAARMVGAFFGDYGFKITSILLFLSVLGYANVNLISNPRMYYAMAEDRVLPRVFMKVNNKTQVQQVALSVFVALIIGIVFFLGTFDKILKYVMLFDTIGLASAAASLFILRRKQKELPAGEIYKMKLYPYPTILFVTVYLLVTVNIFIQDWVGALIGLSMFFIGLPIFFAMRKAVKDKEMP